MSLPNLNVLVDGYNLQLPKGTGIKTYGISLIQSLHTLGVDPSILYSKPFKSYGNSVLSEVEFFNKTQEATLSKRQILAALLQRVVGYQAEKLKLPDQVVRNRQDIIQAELLNYTHIFQAQSCYQIANLLFNLFKQPTQLKVSDKIDIWHSTYPLPLQVKGAKKITTIHDLIPLKLPQTTLDNKTFFYNLVQYSLQNSDLIITVSENSKQDIVSLFDCNPDQIHVTYQPSVLSSSTSVSKTINLKRLLNIFNLQPQNYLLFVGAIEPKKNLGRLIDAYMIVDPKMPLVVVGKKAWLWENELKRLELPIQTRFKEKIIFLDYVSEQDLKFLYQGAYAFIFPSLYEGFGLPPLEAMTLGCPVITSHTSSLPEVCGEAALYIDPYSVEDLVVQIEKLLGDHALRQQLIEAGKERAELFSQKAYLQRLESAYEKLLK